MIIPIDGFLYQIPDFHEERKMQTTKSPYISGTIHTGLSGSKNYSTYDALSSCVYFTETSNNRYLACCKCEYCASLNIIKEDRVECSKCGAALNFQEIEYIKI